MAFNSKYYKGGGGANPYLLAALPGIIGGVAQGIFSGDESERQERLTADQLAAQERERQQRAAGVALQATQMNPLAQQESRQRNAILASLVNRSTRSNASDPSSGANWSAEDFKSFFTPEARLNAENAFNANASAASNNQYTAQTGVGYGGAPTPTSPVMASSAGTSNFDLTGRSDLSDPSDPRGGGVLGGALGGAGTGAALGSIIPGVGTVVGAGVGALTGGLGGLISSRSNDAKEARERLARDLGYGSLAAMNDALRASGPEGAALVDVGLNKIGRKDMAANAEWERQVRRIVSGGGARPSPQYLQRSPSNPNPTLRSLFQGGR